VNITYDKSFLKSLKKVNDAKTKASTLVFIEKAKQIHQLSELSGIKKIQGFSHFYRFRIGKYRLGFKAEGDNLTLIILARREDIYDAFP